MLKVRREIYLHYAHKFYGKTLLLLAYIQVGLGLHAYGAFDEYIEEGKIPTGGKMILLILFLIWYALVFTIFMYKEIVSRTNLKSKNHTGIGISGLAVVLVLNILFLSLSHSSVFSF